MAAIVRVFGSRPCGGRRALPSRAFVNEYENEDEDKDEKDSDYIFAPSLAAQGGGANRAFGTVDEDSCAYRHFFVDVIL